MERHTIPSISKQTIERLRRQNIVSAHLLNACAFLQSDGIPVELLEQCHPMITTSPTATYSKDVMFAAITELVNLSLVRRTKAKGNRNDSVNDILVIHRSVQSIVYDAMEDDQRLQLSKIVAAAINNKIGPCDHGDFRSRISVEPYLPHVRHLVSPYYEASKELADLLDTVVAYLIQSMTMTGTEELAKMNVLVAKEAFGEKSWGEARALTLLANFHSNAQRGYAEELHQQALDIFMEVSGPNHPDTAKCLYNLAIHSFKQRKYHEAELFNLEALRIREKKLEWNHRDTAASLNNLANVYYIQGKYNEAEPLYKRALKIRENVFGPEHHETTLSLNNLAQLYQTQCVYDKAEQLYRRALKNSEVPGRDNSSTAEFLKNLAGLYYDQGRYDNAEPLYQRALEIREKIFGPRHPKVLESLKHLALLYSSQGRFDTAELFNQRVLAIDAEALGSYHPDTAKSLTKLGRA